MGEVKEIPRDWMPLFDWRNRFYDKQIEALNAIKDYWEIVFVAGNGTGKTLWLYWNLICLAYGIHPHQFAEPPLKIKVLVNDFEHGYGKIFTETCLRPIDAFDGKKVGAMLADSMVKKYPSRDDRTLHLKNQSLLFFQTSEQKKSLHSGTNFDILGSDEENKYQVYDESKRGLRTAKGGGRILHSFTPPFDEEDKNKGPTWTKFKLVDPFERGEDPDIYVVKAAMMENPAITPDYIRKFSKGKTEEQINIQIYGHYPTWGKLIHPDFVDRIWNPEDCTGNLLPESFEVPWRDHDVNFEMSVDWHGSKPVAVVWAFEYMAGPNKGDVVVFDEISPNAGKGLTISGASTAIREIEGWRNVKIKRWGDPKMKDKNNALISGFNAWEEFRHCGIRLTEGWNRDPYVGYSIVNDFIRGKGKGYKDHPRLFVRENCKSVIHNMKNHYNVPQSDGTAKPDPKFSDYCVNVKYILQKKSRKIKKNMDRGRYSNNDGYTTIGGPFGRQYIRNPLGYGTKQTIDSMRH